MMRLILIMVTLLFSATVSAQEWRGFAGVEYCAFTDTAAETSQHSGYASLVLDPEFYTAWDDNRQALTVEPFYRRDQYDDNRTHGDVRELFWLYVGSGVEWRVGLHTVFWGVTESQHLVDVINQTDLVENPDGEDKLGQPMINVTLLTDLGTLDVFVLPYFRERTFPGKEGRPRSIPRVDTDADAIYESGQEDRHVDWALRWSHTVGNWDVGLSNFYGTGREPVLSPGFDGNGNPVLIPYYELVNQSGLDLQATLGSWLWKLEAIRRQSDLTTYGALTAGFEYTLSSLFGSRIDLGLVTEYLHDNRDDKATTPFEDDVMVGLRITPNDTQSTEFLAGVIIDRDSSTRIYSVEASRRLTSRFKLSIEARIFTGIESGDSLYSYRRDNHAQIELAYYL